MNEIKGESAGNEVLQCVQLLTMYLSTAPDESIINEAKTILVTKKASLNQHPDICILLGTLFTLHGLYDDALHALSFCLKDPECAGLAVQVYCLINRMDLAIDLMEYTKQLAGPESYQAQIMESWVAIARGDPIKIDEAFYLYEELAATYPTSSKASCAKAICFLQSKRFQDADDFLVEALNKVLDLLS